MPLQSSSSVTDSSCGEEEKDQTQEFEEAVPYYRGARVCEEEQDLVSKTVEWTVNLRWSWNETNMSWLRKNSAIGAELLAFRGRGTFLHGPKPSQAASLRPKVYRARKTAGRHCGQRIVQSMDGDTASAAMKVAEGIVTSKCVGAEARQFKFRATDEAEEENRAILFGAFDDGKRRETVRA